MIELHKLDEVLIGYFTKKSESKQYSILNKLENSKTMKLTNCIIIKPELVEDGRLNSTVMVLRHSHSIDTIKFLDDLFGNFDGFERQIYNQVDIKLWLTKQPEFIEFDKKNNKIYEIEFRYSLTHI